VSYLTADAALTSDIEQVFLHIAGMNTLPRLKRVWLAPFQLQRRLVGKIAALTLGASRGLPARIVLKMNALTDETLMHALVHAGQCGVKIDLIVRGACMLPAQVPGVTDNIRVRSVIGRFLEHSRVFYFSLGGEESLYLSSADWMNRNMLRRIELAWPVTDPVLRQRIVDECLVSYLHDGTDAWDMAPDGSYVRVDTATASIKTGAQEALMQRYGEHAKPSKGRKSWT
jgi:polyphosphate kinase